MSLMIVNFYLHLVAKVRYSNAKQALLKLAEGDLQGDEPAAARLVLVSCRLTRYHPNCVDATWNIGFAG